MELYCNLALLPFVLIVERRREPRLWRGANETPLFKIRGAYLSPLETRIETVLGGQFYWGGILLKSNAGVQRSA